MNKQHPPGSFVASDRPDFQAIELLISRLAEMEFRLVQADDQIDVLNRTAYQQQQQIDRLLLEVRALQSALSASGGTSLSLRDELPPHY